MLPSTALLYLYGTHLHNDDKLDKFNNNNWYVKPLDILNFLHHTNIQRKYQSQCQRINCSTQKQ